MPDSRKLKRPEHKVFTAKDFDHPEDWAYRKDLPLSVDEFDPELFRRGLESNETNTMLRTLMMSHRSLSALVIQQQSQIGLMAKQIEDIHAQSCTSIIYSYVDYSTGGWIKIGFSKSIDEFDKTRSKEHERNGFEFVAKKIGTIKREDQLKKIMKNKGEEPRYRTKEQYRLTKSNIDLLLRLDWPWNVENPYQYLQKHKQIDLNL